MRWADFAAAAPELAGLAREAFDEQHLAILGTIRRNGWPRISPCEVYFVGGELMLGMMVDSTKARDLRRDPRITVVNGQSERIPKRGDSKLYGMAVEVTDQRLRELYGQAIEAAIDWRPAEPFPLYAVDILSASYISFGEGRRALRWSPEGGLERLRHPDDPG
jgi:Pyridoxamine 5'-phosphate oxidase